MPISPQPAIAFAPQNWNRTISSTTVGFAWALMAGFSYQLTPSVAIDIGYRYLNSGVTRTRCQSAVRSDAQAEQRLPAGPHRRALPDTIG